MDASVSQTLQIAGKVLALNPLSSFISTTELFASSAMGLHQHEQAIERMPAIAIQAAPRSFGGGK
jgi:hypothetical protein